MEILGPYRLENRLGQGGMAEVFVATHMGAAGFERKVCVKRILPHVSSDLEFQELFLREVKIAGQLCHSNLVQVFDCIQDQATLGLVMEYVDGMDLKALVSKLRERGETVPHGLVAYIAGQVLKGLCYAHEHRIVHRDISPHNILVSRQGEVKIVDFGVAKALSTHATQTGVRGKIAYMSPEQAQANNVDHRTDLYSAGLVFYELITGERFFPKGTQFQILNSIVNARKPKIEGVVPGLAQLVENLLDPDLQERFQAAEDALSTLPPWEVIGPMGARELMKLVQSLEIVDDELTTPFIKSRSESNAVQSDSVEAPALPETTPALFPGRSSGTEDVTKNDQIFGKKLVPETVELDAFNERYQASLQQSLGKGGRVQWAIIVLIGILFLVTGVGIGAIMRCSCG